MAFLGLTLSVAPRQFWSWGFRRVRLPQNERTVWVQSELTRNSARDIAEAGRELGRFDSRPWLQSIEVPIAVVVTTNDEAVPPRKQRELAAAAGGPVLEAPIRHLEIVTRASTYNPVLLEALERVRAPEHASAA
jgi:hypothetical protein